MSMSDTSYRSIPATMERGRCRYCGKESFCCGRVWFKKRKCLLCSDCRIVFAGQWKAVEPMNMRDFAVEERMAEVAEQKTEVEAAYDEGR